MKSGTAVQLEIRLLGAAATEDPGETHSPIALDSFVCVESFGGDVSAEHGLQVQMSERFLLVVKVVEIVIVIGYDGGKH